MYLYHSLEHEKLLASPLSNTVVAIEFGGTRGREKYW
jgi:hypothetical protein